MTLSSLLKDYGAYNVWANARVFDWLLSHPVEHMDKEAASSFASIRLTITHIWGAQDVWLKRLRGHSPDQFIANTFTGDAEAAIAGARQSSEDLSAFLTAQHDEFFTQAMDYKDLKGNAYRNTMGDMVLHCIQHSTYHRGQLVTIARGLGLTDPPSTDYIVFARMPNA
jgi:uncharacterized damage-inducible protein DinB